MELTVRTIKALRRALDPSVALPYRDLMALAFTMSDDELLAIRGIGSKAVQQIRAAAEDGS